MSSVPPGAVDLPIRLAIRHEGTFIIAYYAKQGTMKGAVHLGTIRKTLVESNRELFDKWRQVMQEAMGTLIKEATGIAPVWKDPEKAPEHERAGSA